MLDSKWRRHSVPWPPSSMAGCGGYFVHLTFQKLFEFFDYLCYTSIDNFGNGNHGICPEEFFSWIRPPEAPPPVTSRRSSYQPSKSVETLDLWTWRRKIWQKSHKACILLCDKRSLPNKFQLNLVLSEILPTKLASQSFMPIGGRV